MIVWLPTVATLKNDNLSRIYSAFVGEKPAYQGMIEIWNIDTFEAGDVSKTNLLNLAAKNFQKKYRGVYVLVRNVSETECKNMLAGGQRPDMFSCSYGVSEMIRPYLQPFSRNDFAVFDNFLAAGRDENQNLFGLAWCSGIYFLISSKSSLEKAGTFDFENFSLAKNAFSLGYETSGKKPKKIYSIALPNKGRLLPKQAILAYNGSETILENELSFDGVAALSQYDAYVNFLLGKSVMFAGSQRDVLKILRRQESGKISDVFIEPLNTFSDLVQFLFVAKCEDATKTQFLELFASEIVSEKFQKQVAASGMLSACKNLNFESEICWFNQRENLEKIRLNSVF